MSSELTFVPSARALSISGDFYKLLAFMKSEEWDRGDFDVIALHALFTGGWYVFEPRVLGARTREFFELDTPRQTQAAFQDIFDIHEYRALPKADRDTQPAQPSVVLTPDKKFEGTWIALTSVRRSAKPRIRGEVLGSAPFRRGTQSMAAPSSGSDVGATSSAAGSSRRSRSRPPSPGTAATQPPAGPLQRTPHMDFSSQAPFAPTTVFEVEVFANDQAPAAGEDSEGISLPGTEEEYALKVWLAPSAEFTVLGADVQPLIIRRSEARSCSARFRVRVADAAKTGKLGALTASLSYAGRPCGRVTRTLLIGPGGTKASATENKRARDFQGSVTLERESPPQPDLTVVITCPDGDADRYVVSVSSPLLADFKDGVARPWTLRQAAGALVRTTLANFVKDGISDQRRLDNLVGAGRNFFTASPQHFQDAFWQLVRKKALRSIYIVSEEPHIPWELMVPVPKAPDIDGRKWRPLGVEFAIGRWIHQGHASPPGSVTLSSAFILAPDYQGTSLAVLENATTEADFIRSQFGGAAFTPVTYDAIRTRIGTELTPLFHFVGHGAVTPEGDDENIYLDKEETLSTTEVQGIDGFAEGFRKTRPLVFFNACEVGRSVPALVGSGGFPRTFVALGASAVIAPLWSVQDSCAHEVATIIYQAVKDDARSGAKRRPVAEILQTLRARCYDPGAEQGIDSFAAYCFYGDPSFVLKLP